MATKTTTARSKAADEPLVALTVKVTRKTYRRLMALRLKGNDNGKLRSHQNIVETALLRYLDEQDV